MLLAPILSYAWPMGAIQIKNVPEGLHDAIRSRAAEEGRTVSDYVLDLIRHDLEVPTMRAWLARLRTHEPVEPFDSVALIHELREEREQELDRRVGPIAPQDDDATE